MYRSVKGLSGIAQFGILLAFLGAGFIVAGLLQLLIGMMIIPETATLSDGNAIINAMLDPQNVSYMRIAQVVGTFFLFFVPAYMFSVVANGTSFFWIGFNRYYNAKQVLIAFVIIIVASIAFAPLADLTREFVAGFPKLDELAKGLEEAYNKQVKVLSNLQSWPEYLLALAIMAFFPAMFEEVFFRGVLQNLLEKWWRNAVLAIIVTSIVFSIFHSSVYLFPTRVLLGCILGLMYFFTRNIWINIIAHFLNNAFALTQMFILSRNHQEVNVDKLDPQMHWMWSIVAFAGLFFLIFYLRKISLRFVARIEEKEAVLRLKNSNNPFAQ